MSLISQENTYVRVAFLIKLLTQVFSCEFSGNFKSTFFTDHLRAMASAAWATV